VRKEKERWQQQQQQQRQKIDEKTKRFIYAMTMP
jgi:hypothetical protein